MTNDKFDRTIKNFHFRQILVNDENDLQTLDKINKSSIIVIDEYFYDMKKYLIMCLERELNIIQLCNEKIDETFFSEKYKEKVCFVKQENSDFIEMRSNFMSKFQIKKVKNPLVTEFWKIIRKCMATFFIKKV